jgi:4,5-DOPA dioxygenase extradiol
MASTTLPSIFLSHGSPMLALQPGEAGAFMQRLGRAIDATYGRPAAIVAVSAHTLAREPVLFAAPRHEAIHDFGGFPPELYAMRYEAPGAPDLAPRVASLLRSAHLPAHVTDQGGLDHGIWTALHWVYPEGDVPVLPLGFVPTQPPAALFELGRALAPLRAEGVLVLGTGSITHNLRRLSMGAVRDAVAPPVMPEIPESAAFRDWIYGQSQTRDWTALFDYRRRAPYAVDMHPTDEHLLPWFVAAGAGGQASVPVRLHASVTLGALGMDAYAFGEEAARLGRV